MKSKPNILETLSKEWEKQREKDIKVIRMHREFETSHDTLHGTRIQSKPKKSA
jgi:hypothetical protein